MSRSLVSRSRGGRVNPAELEQSSLLAMHTGLCSCLGDVAMRKSLSSKLKQNICCGHLSAHSQFSKISHYNPIAIYLLKWG